MEDPTGAPEVLGRLKALGVGLAIDDFGTGYSSLAYLRRFPVDIVKIDRAFVDGPRRPDSADATLVAAIVAMAEALGVTTIAEGVESETQAERLLELGCTVAQGYLFSRPMPADDVPATVDRPRDAGPGAGSGRCAAPTAPERGRAVGRSPPAAARAHARPQQRRPRRAAARSADPES